MTPEVRVVPFPGDRPDLWIVKCTVHGHLPELWVGRAGASFNAMGHAAAHHAIPST